MIVSNLKNIRFFYILRINSFKIHKSYIHCMQPIMHERAKDAEYLLNYRRRQNFESDLKNKVVLQGICQPLS